MLNTLRQVFRIGTCLAMAMLFAGGATCPIQQLPGGGSNNQPGGNGGGSNGGTAGQNGGNNGGGGVVPNVGDNTALEQLALERVNRARLDPAGEAARFGIDLNEGVTGTPLTATPKQPLAFNPALTGAARSHAQDMLARDYFEHNSPEGVSPFDRMTNAGYVYQYAGENLAWRGTTGTLNEAQTLEQEHRDLFVDSNIAGRGHRVVMLRDNFKETGIGVVRGVFTQQATNYNSLMWAEDFGARFNSPQFITGVVYNDSNSNGDYDFGEGVSNVPVIVNGVSTNTNSGGGYAIAVQGPGSYDMQFPSGGPVSVTVTTKNVKVDQVNGNQVIINRGVGPL